MMVAGDLPWESSSNLKLSPALIRTDEMKPSRASRSSTRVAVSRFEAHGTGIDAVLSDNGREFCGREDQHPYELFLQLEGIGHKRTRVKRPQSNGIVERLHRTLLDEHFRVECRRTWFEAIEEMQVSLDEYLVAYNTRRPHQGRAMNGSPPRKSLHRRPAEGNQRTDF